MPNFLTRLQAQKRLEGKTVAVVGSGPGVLSNPENFIDSHDVVLRVNNYHIFREGSRRFVTGQRTDVYYSFFGSSIRKTSHELIKDGVTLCLCKCPNSYAITHSEWHIKNDKMTGVDFRYIYELRNGWWFCDTYIPTDEDFLASFNMLKYHIPTTGFSAILEVLESKPKGVYLTGFDFFRSGIHNVRVPWRMKNNGDPIGHVPEKELEWLRDNQHKYPITADAHLAKLLEKS